MIKEILAKADYSTLSVEEIAILLSAEGEDKALLFETAAHYKQQTVGSKVFLRGLIEYSNKCAKDCYYCGVRSSSTAYQRYTVSDEEVLEAVEYAYKHNFSSLVIQSGERHTVAFTNQVTRLLEKITRITNGEMGITLSMGEQKKEVYAAWRKAGATRYLLRIESSNRALFRKIHPDNKLHDFQTRVDALRLLKECDYQVGTGVMIGLPFQDIEILAADIDFMRKIDIDMCGMGPYIEHEDTPLYQYKHLLLPLQERLELSLKMVAVLRLVMKTINIAATTAMQTIDSNGREKAIRIGANVVMPNLTPLNYRENYYLYNNKVGVVDDVKRGLDSLTENIEATGSFIAYGEKGDAKHYRDRKNKDKH